MKRFLFVSILALLGFVIGLQWFRSQKSTESEPGTWLKKANTRFNVNYQSTNKDNPGPLAPHFIDNSGVFSADVNRDRWPDLLMTGGTQPKLYLNRNGRFREQTDFPAVDVKIASAAFVDFTSNGWKDLVLVPQEGRIRVLENDSGRFTNKTILPDPTLSSGVGVTVGDLNQSGCADLVVLQYAPNGKAPDAPVRHKLYRLGKPDQSLPRKDSGDPNYLLFGNCKGQFEVVERSNFQRRHFSLAASTADFNGNGTLDIHVANDFYWDSLYLNQGQGEFHHTYLPDSTDRNGMASAVTDLNDDGLPDLFVSNIHVPGKSSIFQRDNFRFLATSTPAGHNLLFNQGEGQFQDIATEAGVNPPGWGWNAVFVDLNNNGRRELFQCQQDYLRSGRKMRVFDLRTPGLASLLERENGSDTDSLNSLHDRDYHELRHWMGFPLVYRRSNKALEYDYSLLENHRQDCRGNVTADFNRNGTRDLILSVYDGTYRLLENLTAEENNWLKIYVDDPRFIRGGTVQMHFRDERRVFPLTSGTGFKSQQPAIFHQGTGGIDTLEKLEIHWNTGGKSTITDLNLPVELVANRKGLRTLDE